MPEIIVDILKRLADNSPILAALFLVCSVSVAILYYLVRQHLPAQTAAFNQAITSHREAFGEALKQNAEQSARFIEYMKTTREAESKALMQVLDKILTTHEKQSEEMSREIKQMGVAFTRLRSTIHQHHDLVRAAGREGDGMADVDIEERDLYDEPEKRRARA